MTPNRAFAVGLILAPMACDTSAPDGGAGRWEGTVDTLSSGHVVVRNEGHGVWAEGEGWEVVEELRIGSVDGDGPSTLGDVASVAVDDDGRLWIIDSQAREIRVFDAEGGHVRTVGGPGEGPGEFERPVRIDRAPDGRMWVMDPENARVSVFDSAGTYVAGHEVQGGFVVFPWRGGFDERGRYHTPVVRMEPSFGIVTGVFDSTFAAVDTLEGPSSPLDGEAFTIERDGLTRVAAGVPFQGSLEWRRSPDGTIWALVTDRYRLFQLDEDGETLRTVRRDVPPIPVTTRDVEQAIEDLEWFTNQGGVIDRSKFPDTKPPVTNLFVDEGGNVWVARRPDGREGGAGPGGEVGGHTRFDVFDPSGRYLGEVDAPFAVDFSPVPFVVDGAFYAVVRDELEVPYVVRARIEGADGR